MAGRTFVNWLRTLGAPEDPVATDISSPWSAMSLLKAIYQKIADGSIAAGVAGSADSIIKVAVAGAIAQVNQAAKRASSISASAAASASQVEALGTFVRGAVAKCAQYMRQARTSRIAAASSASNASASEINAAGSSVLAAQSVNIAAGFALFGQRAKRDRVAAAASAVAAAASAASVPTTEQAVLGIQVYS